jgi:hypothetical protein
MSTESTPQPEPAAAPTAATVEFVDVIMDSAGSVAQYLIAKSSSPDQQPTFILRRYSEFDTFRATVLGAAEAVEAGGAPFPEKLWFGYWQADVVASRRSLLCDWLNAMLALSPPPPELAAFLQPTSEDTSKTKELLARFSDPMVAQQGRSPAEYVQYTTPHGEGGKHYATSRDACMTIARAEAGIASKEGEYRTRRPTQPKFLFRARMCWVGETGRSDARVSMIVHRYHGHEALCHGQGHWRRRESALVGGPH